VGEMKNCPYTTIVFFSSPNELIQNNEQIEYIKFQNKNESCIGIRINLKENLSIESIHIKLGFYLCLNKKIFTEKSDFADIRHNTDLFITFRKKNLCKGNVCICKWIPTQIYQKTKPDSITNNTNTVVVKFEKPMLNRKSFTETDDKKRPTEKELAEFKWISSGVDYLNFSVTDDDELISLLTDQTQITLKSKQGNQVEFYSNRYNGYIFTVSPTLCYCSLSSEFQKNRDYLCNNCLIVSSDL
jgi:hypothetical protein